MQRAALTILATLALAATLPAKGRTVQITITGISGRPIQVSSDTVGQFHIWSGPGTSVNGVSQPEGFIAEWSKGPVAERAAASRRYEGYFYTGCKPEIEGRCRSTEPVLAYMVTYEYDPATQTGYVYLPAKGEQGWALNASSIFRGVEGKWFRATGEWERFVNSLIEQQRLATPPARP